MSQPSIADLQNRILSLEAQLQRMQEQYPVRSGQGSQDQVRYGDHRTVTDNIPPMAPEVAQQEFREGEQAQTERRAAVAEMEIPDFDPYAWGEPEEGQSAAGRRQELVQIQKRRAAQKQAQQDQVVLNQSTMDIDSQPPEAQFAAAQAFADDHRARVAQEQAGRPNVRPAQRPVPQQPFQQVSPPPMPESFDLPQRPEGEAGQRWDRQQRREAQRQLQQQPAPPPVEIPVRGERPVVEPVPMPERRQGGIQPVTMPERGQPPRQPVPPYTPPTQLPPQQPPPTQPPYTPGQGQPPYRMPPPYVPQPDTSTQIPQPPDWRDTPERLTRGPTYPPQAQQQTFGQAQASFDAAAARQMQMLAGFVQDATRRVEELECWRESMA